MFSLTKWIAVAGQNSASAVDHSFSDRLLGACFNHEINSFSTLPTDLAAYRARALHFDDEIVPTYAGTNTEIGGFLAACERNGWMPVPSVVADATPSGKVTSEAYDTITRHLLTTLEKSQPVNAVLLQLHGAMVVEDRADGQADLLEQISARVGPEVPVVVSLDLHANVSDKLVFDRGCAQYLNCLMIM